MLTRTSDVQLQVTEQELRHAETEHHRWKREAETAGEPGRRAAAAAQAAWYAQQVLRQRQQLGRLRRGDG